eukprot:1119809-Pleurochrysis_carterae.AAC.3
MALARARAMTVAIETVMGRVERRGCEEGGESRMVCDWYECTSGCEGDSEVGGGGVEKRSAGRRERRRCKEVEAACELASDKGRAGKSEEERQRVGAVAEKEKRTKSGDGGT